MGSAPQSSELARAVRRLLARPSCASQASASVVGPVARSAVMGGIALLTMAPGVVNAVGLGEARTTSALGEPLRATVPMRLSAGEIVRPGCVTTPVRPGSQLRSPTGTRVRSPETTGPGMLDLEVTTRQPLYEPLYELTLQVDCPGLPKIMRHYVLMLDLPGMALPATSRAATTAPLQGNAGVTVRDNPGSGSAPRRSGRLAATRDPVPAGQRYRVREGDTLSTIAARVEGRAPNTTWQLAEKIFAANPRAFIAGNPDLIKLGFEITIPVPGKLAATAGEPAPSAPVAPRELALAAEAAARVAAVEAAARVAAVEAEIAAVQQALREARSAPAATTPSLDAEPGAQPAADSLSNVDETVDVSKDIVLPPTSGSPFADEVTGRELEPEAAAAVEPPPPISFAPRQSSQVNPLLAVLMGLLLGLGLSILLLRSRLLEGLSNLFARSRAAPAIAPAEQTYADTDEWLKTEEGLHAEALAVGPPAEQTYIVEVNESEQTAAATGGPVTDKSADFAAPFAPPDSEYEPELDELETAEAPGIPATAETAETAEMPDIAPTAEMPSIAPTAEMPGVGQTASMRGIGQPGSASDPAPTAETVAMPEAVFDPTVEPDMAELFADDLSDLPGEPDLPVEVFAGMDADPDASALAPTADMPRFADADDELDDATLGAPNVGLEGLITDGDATEGMELQGLSEDYVDDSQLPDTLQQALSLLERDFNEELTASQIIDQDALKKVIAEKDEADEDTDALQDPQRKRAG